MKKKKQHCEMASGFVLKSNSVFCFRVTGIPVWIGRKLHTRYRLSGKHKRNFAVLGGVAASVSRWNYYT